MPDVNTVDDDDEHLGKQTGIAKKTPRVRYEELGEVGRKVQRELGTEEDSRITHG